MDATQTKQYLAVAVEAAWQAASAILEVKAKGYDTTFKSDASPVTEADLASNAVIEKYLSPIGLPLLSEEGELPEFDVRKHWTSYWSIDPLDGTKEFTRGSDEYTVNVALIVDRQPVGGVIVLPERGKGYWGGPEIGLFESAAPVKAENAYEVYHKLKPVDSPRSFTAVVSRAHLNTKTRFYLDQLQEKHGQITVRRAGSSTKFIDIAKGKADLYPRFSPCMEWDTAAGHALLRATGQEIISLETQKPLLYNRESLYNPPFIAGKTQR